MRAAIRAAMLLEDGSDVGSYRSTNALQDSVWIRLLIGPAESRETESFDINVCTPGWLEREAKRGPFLPLNCLVLPSVDLVSAVSFLQERVASIEAQGWTDLAQRISRFSRWEFEDYVA